MTSTRTPSRAPSLSRSTTPNPGGLGNHRSPAKLAIPPALRQSPSLSNLRVHSYNASATASDVPPVPSIPIASKSTESQSSASSVFNLDLDSTNGNRILVQDVDTEDSVDEDVGDESKEGESQKLLRDQLRRTLSSSRTTVSSRPRAAAYWLPDSRRAFNQRLSPREYFVLTDAGKPVFISRGTDTDDSNISSILGIMQALISVFIDDGDKLKSINAGRTRITFLQRQPLYYACVSSWGEPESVTRSHLEYLHLQILSVVTSAQLKRIFERRGNFDLRRLLGGADTFLTTMLSRLQLDLAMSMSALRCLRLDSGLRNKAAQALVPSGKVSKDILYIILVARGEIITLIRPKKHSVHPADVHILLTTLASPSLSNSPATAMWVPLCLPKWNDSRMVNAYVVNMPYVDDASLSSNAEIDSLPTPTSLDNPDDDSDSHTSTETRTQRKDNVNHNTITLVCISGGSDFDTVRAWCDDAVEKLSYLPSNSSSSLSSTSSTMTVTPNTAAPPIPRPPASSSTLHHLHTHLLHSSYTVSELGIPGLRHFVYKARGLVQVTFPVWEQGEEKDDSEAEMEEEEGEDDERRRIITMYQMVHDAIHAKGVTGQSKEGLKLQYLRTDKESVLGWITQPFELYLTLSPLLPKSAAVGAANAVARWVKKEEGRLFLKDAPVL